MTDGVTCTEWARNRSRNVQGMARVVIDGYSTWRTTRFAGDSFGDFEKNKQGGFTNTLPPIS